MVSDKPDRAKPGRTAKREYKKRTDRVIFRLTADELARVQIEAAQAGASLSAYCRAAVLGMRLPARKSRDVAGVLVELNRVGVNLNQIARAVNRGQGVPYDLGDTLAEVRAAVEVLAGADE